MTPDRAPRAFISYSHDSLDHGERVLALSARLRAVGIETMLDRYQAPPEMGWPRWMVRNIRDADFVIMICTDRYYSRVMGDEEEGQGLGVRWEGHLIFQHLHDAGSLNLKFIPVIFGAAYRRFIPDPVRGYSFYDVTSDEGFERLHRHLTGQSEAQVPALGSSRQLPVPERLWRDRPPPPLIGVPRFPRYYLERTHELAELKQKLLVDGSHRLGITSSGSQFALHGMGGIGKTMLAAALCRAPEVAARFPDGIVWLTLGQSPSVERRQIDLYECFSSTAATFEDVPSGCIALARLLAEKRCLVVVDDVWRQADARAFDVVGPEGALLITTRDAGIVRSLAIEAFGVGTLDDAQGAMLLAASSGRAVAELTPVAYELVRECGHLPLAIAMAGGMVHAIADPWPAVLRRLRSYRLDQIRLDFPDYPYPDLLRAVQASTDNLKSDYRAAYAALAIFPEDTHIPRETLQTLWSSEEVDELELSLIIRDLTEKSLLFRDEHDRHFVHDVQRAFLMRAAGDELPAMHARLLDRYAARCDAGWTSGPDDGYFFEHLVYHLAAAGRAEEALAVVADAEWLDGQLRRHGILAVVGDCEAIADAERSDAQTRSTALSIRDAIRLAGHRLERQPEALAEQMHGRLRSDADPAIRRLLKDSQERRAGMWLRPAFASLDQPGGALQRIIEQDFTPTVVLGLPGGRILSAAGKTLQIYDQASGVLLRRLDSHDADVRHAAVSDDGTLLVSASRDGVVKVFDLGDGSCRAERQVPAPPARRTAEHDWMGGDSESPHVGRLASIPGSSLFVGADSHAFGLWLIDITDLSFTYLPVEHTKEITSVAVTSSGEQIVSAGKDATIRIWDRRREATVRIITLPDAWAYVARIGAIVLTPDGRQAISSSSWSGPLKVWDIASGEEVKTIGGDDDFSVALALSPDGSTLYEGGYFRVHELLSGLNVYRYSFIRLWDIPSGRLVRELHGHHAHINSLALSSDGISLLSASSDKTLRVWRLDIEAEVQPHAGNSFDKAIDYVGIDRSCARVLASHKSAAASFDVGSGRKVAQYTPQDGADANIEGACFAADGKSILLAVGRGFEDRTTRLEVFDAETGAPLRSLQDLREVDPDVSNLQGFRISADGHHAVAVGMCYAEIDDGGFANQAVVVWQVESGKIAAVVHVPTPNHGKPYAEQWPAAISADSRYYCFGTVEDEFRLCDLANDLAITTFGEHRGWIGGVVILTAAGLAVTAGGNDETIRAWSLATGALAWEWTNMGRTSCMAASPSERYLILGNQAGELRLLSIESGKAAASFQFDAPPTALNVSPERPLVAVGDETGRVHVFVVENCPDW